MASNSTESQFRDWASLPHGLIELVSQKLPCSFDYISFRSVCSSWRSTAPQIKFAPLIMFPFDANAGTIKFFSPSDDRSFFLILPALCHKVLCGSAQGMLVLMDESADISLLSPFTQEQLKLPPGNEDLAFLASGKRVMRVGEHWACFTKNKSLINLCMPIGLSEIRHNFIKEAILSSSPNSGKDCYVMATLASSNKVAFCMLGDEVWTLVDTNLSSSVWSVTYCNRRFYAVDLDGKVAFCDLENPMNFIPLALPEFSRECTAFKLLDSRGELMLVALIINQETIVRDDDLGRYNYEIYKLDMMGEPMWSRVNSIGEVTLFVSRYYNSHSQYLGGRLREWRGNCLCFPEPTVNVPNRVVSETVHMELVDLADGSKRFISTNEIKRHSEFVSWFKPNLASSFSSSLRHGGN